MSAAEKLIVGNNRQCSAIIEVTAFSRLGSNYENLKRTKAMTIIGSE